MPVRSAGILCFRFRGSIIEFFLVFPGGPFWAKKDLGAWTIPKGEIGIGEEPLNAAIREMEEETGVKAEGNFIELTPVRQASGKIVQAWAVEMEIDDTRIVSNEFEMEWPPKSGRQQSFPEISKAGWFDGETAKQKILPSQLPLILELEELVG
jgi:predicted NUDIX family NTP pyrophosphohydrolase